MSSLRNEAVDDVVQGVAVSSNSGARGSAEHPGGLPEALEVLRLSLRSPNTAKVRFPGYRLTRLVTARLDLGPDDLSPFADILGVDVLRAAPDVLEPFNAHLRWIIARYGLQTLFGDDRQSPHHHAIRPTGYDFERDEVIPVGMEKWRATFRDLPTERQMLAASIIWLYRAGKDNAWLRRVPCTWHATDAISCMRATLVLQDWARLLALYPGW